MKIGLDVMGGDFAPTVTIEGAIAALDKISSSDSIVLFGPEEVITKELTDRNFDPGKFVIVHAPDIIGMGDKPIKAFTQKPDSSISKGLKCLKHHEIDSFASAGNSGATMVGAMYTVSNIHGVIRPCTLTLVPKETTGMNVMLDIGTNPDVKPDVLYQFAILGSIYSKIILGVKDPKIGLLNVGEEEEKGNLTCQAAFPLMKDSKDFNFFGNVEGRDLFKDRADVIVCDGFTGNILLKALEAVYRQMMKRKMKDEFFDRFNYEIYGGSPILGVNAPVIIGHGISSSKAILNMILLSKEIYDTGLTKKIKKAMSNYMGSR
jgi:phosphate acyltransferase